MKIHITHLILYETFFQDANFSLNSTEMETRALHYPSTEVTAHPGAPVTISAGVTNWRASHEMNRLTVQVFWRNKKKKILHEVALNRSGELL